MMELGSEREQDKNSLPGPGKPWGCTHSQDLSVGLACTYRWWAHTYLVFLSMALPLTRHPRLTLLSSGAG